MTALLTQIGEFLVQFIQWLSQILTFVVSDQGAPLGVFIYLSILGLVIGMVRRWLPGRS